MDRKMIDLHKDSGFSLLELMVVVAIVGILAVGFVSTNRKKNLVSQVNDDFHSISVFLKQLRLDALTRKNNIDITVTPLGLSTLITPTIGAQVGIATPGRSLLLNHPMLVTTNAGAPPPHFSISSRGNITTTGNIRLDYVAGVPDLPPANRLRYSCVVIDNIRVRLGAINVDGVTCDAI